MSFRRIPFQFSSTDPVQRQAELEKRFGLPSSSMYVDVANPLSKGSSNKEPNLTANSPRLQHRVPIFVEGRDQPIKSSVDSMTSSSDCKKKPNVRVIPIEIEGAESKPATRHRTFSGPAGWAKGNEEHVPQREGSPTKRSMQDLSGPTKIRASDGPIVHNIPIKIEGLSEQIKNPRRSDKAEFNFSKEKHSNLNGCIASKQPNKVKSSEKEHKADSVFEISLEKIQNVLEELKLYDSDVMKFTGTVTDKQYRYLDEMLTRCMLRLDDIDTMGNEKVRSARKNAVKKVQACIDLLETKVNPGNKAITDELGNTTEECSISEEAMSMDVKEMNAENTCIEDITTKNVEGRNCLNQASEVEITKEDESEVQSCNSDVVPYASINLMTTERTEVELPQEKDSNEIQFKLGEWGKGKADIVSTEVKIDQKMPDASEIEMTEAENLSSSQNDVPEKIEVCEIEMTEKQSGESESLNSDGNTILNEISADDIVETVENPKDPSGLDNAGTMNKITDIEMEDIRTQSMPDENISLEKSNALSPKPVLEVSSSRMPSISYILEENRIISDCDKGISNPAIGTSAKQAELLSGKALTEEVSEICVDPIIKDILNGKVAEVSSEIKNNSNDM